MAATTPRMTIPTQLVLQTLLVEPPRHPMVLSGRAEQSQGFERDD